MQKKILTNVCALFSFKPNTIAMFYFNQRTAVFINSGNSKCNKNNPPPKKNIEKSEDS